MSDFDTAMYICIIAFFFVLLIRLLINIIKSNWLDKR